MLTFYNSKMHINKFSLEVQITLYIICDNPIVERTFLIFKIYYFHQYSILFSFHDYKNAYYVFLFSPGKDQNTQKLRRELKICLKVGRFINIFMNKLRNFLNLNIFLMPS